MPSATWLLRKNIDTRDCSHPVSYAADGFAKDMFSRRYVDFQVGADIFLVGDCDIVLARLPVMLLAMTQPQYVPLPRETTQLNSVIGSSECALQFSAISTTARKVPIIAAFLRDASASDGHGTIAGSPVQRFLVFHHTVPSIWLKRRSRSKTASCAGVKFSSRKARAARAVCAKEASEKKRRPGSAPCRAWRRSRRRPESRGS